MDDQLVRRLVDLNTQFYNNLAAPFAASRAAPQPGYLQILDCLPMRPLAVLDVGCGNGRFGRFLREAGLLQSYTGVDGSSALLSQINDLEGQFFIRDISLANSLDGLSEYDVIACLATLQHIPGQENRQRLLYEMSNHLKPAGHLVLSNWQFLHNPRQRRKIRPWSDVGIDPLNLEANDYLISWERGGSGVRYVSFLNEEAVATMAAEAELRVVKQFKSDGREGDLNLYTILAG